MPVELYVSHAQPDNASMIVDGVMYCCTVFLDYPSNTVQSVCVVRQEHGQDVELFRRTVRQVPVEAEEHFPDCPRILVAGTTFVVHWLEGERNTQPNLHRATLDMSTYRTSPTWTYRGSILTSDAWLYDAQPVVGDPDGDFAYTFTSPLTDLIQVRRHDTTAGFAWGSTHWSETVPVAPVRAVLGIYANEDDNAVVVAYQHPATVNTLWGHRLDADNGSSDAGAQLFSDIELGNFTQVTIERFGPNDLAIAAEMQQTPSVGEPFPQVVCRRFDAAGLGPLGQEHRTWHLSLLSRLYAYAGPRTDGTSPNIYAAVGYKRVDTNFEWEEALAFIADFEADRWEDDPFTIRVRPVININTGSIDARVAGATPGGAGPTGTETGRRANHLCSPAGAAVAGPGLKTRTLALMSFAKVLKVSASALGEPLIPTNATVASYVHYLEDAWLRHRDDTDPAEPAANFHAAYPQTQYQHTSIGGQLLISGGRPQVYDGHQIVELGYDWTPEITGVFTGGNGTGDLSAGTYQVTFTWEWRDRRGRLHRSRPGTPWSFDTDPAGDDSATYTVRTLSTSMKDNTAWYYDAQPIKAVLWRTTAGGTIFRRVHAAQTAPDDYAPQNTPRNVPTDYRIVVEDDDIDDESLQQHELLPYQFVNGQWTPLPPWQPPASGPITTWKNRVWLAPNDGTLWYSQEILPEPGGSIATPPEFNPQLVYRIDALDVVTGLAVMDELLVVFTRSGIYALSGEPADANGQGASLDLQVLTETVGCIEPRSIVLSPAGLFFQAANGVHLLSRTLEVDYVSAGYAVEQSLRTGGNIRAASHIHDRHQIRLVTNAAVTGAPLVLCYDYLFKLWASYPLPLGDEDEWLSAAAGGCTWRGALGASVHVVVLQGAVLIERPRGDAEEYADDSIDGPVAVPIRVETGWINPGGKLRYERNREALIQLYKPQASAVSVDVYYDTTGAHDDTVSDTLEQSPAPPLFRRRFSRQKCPIRLAVRESGDVPLTQNLAIVGFSLVVGVLRGHRRART